MFEKYYFILGIVNNLFLIIIFILRGIRNKQWLKKVGKAYLYLAVPAFYGVYLVLSQDKNIRYGIFLDIFILFILLEGLYDHVLKLNFRKNWKLLTPYLLLYYGMSYGFVVMVWQDSLTRGIIMLTLFLIQLLANLGTHRLIKKIK